MSSPIEAGGPYCAYLWCHHRPDPPAHHPVWQIITGYSEHESGTDDR